MHERVLTSTFDGGRFQVTKHLQGQGFRQLFLGVDTAINEIVLIAEWATGLYPFAKKSYAHGPIEDNQVALEAPARLSTLLASGMHLDATRRPPLSAFLSELERC